MDTTTFGMPSASYPATGCNFAEFFGPQQLVLVTTLCGSWAGVPDIYAQTCPGNCITSNIIGPGSPKYDDAYWDIAYIRTYLADGSQPLPASSSAVSPSSPGQVVTSTSKVNPTPSPTTGSAANSNTGGQGNGAPRLTDSAPLQKFLGMVALLYALSIMI
ncbi:hypothetical protein H0H87_001523 [Tephrocybe sp. NHM501043]|nr:hypothetical protein H0H87_001523 [Tephrocybe sp. NHM501043]